MTKNQIRAELRRSACEDDMPWDGVQIWAWFPMEKYLVHGENMLKVARVSYDDQRIFFLLVAEAME